MGRQIQLDEGLPHPRIVGQPQIAGGRVHVLRSVAMGQWSRRTGLCCSFLAQAVYKGPWPQPSRFFVEHSRMELQRCGDLQAEQQTTDIQETCIALELCTP